VEFRLQQFWKWAVDEDEVAASPMARMDAVTVPRSRCRSSPTKTCASSSGGRGIRVRRAARHRIFLMLYDTGSGVASSRAASGGRGLDNNVAFVMGRGAARIAPWKGDRVGLDRYLRARRKHRPRERRTLAPVGLAP